MLLLFAIIGFIIVYNAPGTAIRQTTLYQLGFSNYDIIDTIIMIGVYTTKSIIAWLNFKWVLSLIILTPLSLRISKNIKYNIMNVVCIVLFCSVFVVCGMFEVPYYATNTFGDLRLINVVWITFIILSWIIYTLILVVLEKNQFINLNLDLNNVNTKNCITILVILSLFFIFYMPQNDEYSNFYICLQELKDGTAEKFAKEMDDRFKLINSHNTTEIKLKKITPGSILYLSDINTNPNEWPNTSVEEYYNKKSIYVYE